jgi:hypothetical protein
VRQAGRLGRPRQNQGKEINMGKGNFSQRKEAKKPKKAKAAKGKAK